jgi:hypothetical protein
MLQGKLKKIKRKRKYYTWLLVSMIKPLASSNDWLSIKEKVEFALYPLLKGYWSSRWTQNEWHDYMSLFYKDREIEIRK